jgi:L-threonylcarbamoyladenylate synthase
MKKLWFRRKTYGYGWTPVSWEGWAALAVYIALNVFAFLAVDAREHSASDTLINFAPRFLLLTLIFYIVAFCTGEKPRWQWGPPSPRPFSAGQGKEKVSLENALREGGVAVIPTDTTYGIVGSALNKETVERVYAIRKRDLDKPFIILIAERDDIKKFGCLPTEAQNKILDRVWPAHINTSAGKPSFAEAMADKPRPTTVILQSSDPRFSYLHRGKNTIAFRLPAKGELRDLIRAVGPLVAPSANPQGMLPAVNVAEARAYFGNQIDFYQDGGAVIASPSKIIDITSGVERVLRQ